MAWLLFLSFQFPLLVLKKGFLSHFVFSKQSSVKEENRAELRQPGWGLGEVVEWPLLQQQHQQLLQPPVPTVTPWSRSGGWNASVQQSWWAPLWPEAPGVSCPGVAAEGRNKTLCGIPQLFLLEKCHGWSWGDYSILSTETHLPSREWLEMLPSLRLVFAGKIVKPLSSAAHHLPVCFTNSALQGLPPPSQESLASPTGTQAISARSPFASGSLQMFSICLCHQTGCSGC